jgi:hypothetical protein
MLLGMSTARSPWIDGAAERGISTASQICRAFCNKHSTDWDIKIGAFEFGVNNAKIPHLDKSAFGLDVKGTPRTPISLLMRAHLPVEPMLRVDQEDSPFHFLNSYAEVMNKAKAQMEKLLQQQTDRLTARAPTPVALHPGMLVMVQNPKSGSGPDWKKLKTLEPRYIGPFALIKQTGPGRWQLQLPQGSRMHDQFTVDKFKVVGPGMVLENVGPSELITGPPTDFEERPDQLTVPAPPVALLPSQQPPLLPMLPPVPSTTLALTLSFRIATEKADTVPAKDGWHVDRPYLQLQVTDTQQNTVDLKLEQDCKQYIPNLLQMYHEPSFVNHLRTVQDQAKVAFQVKYTWWLTTLANDWHKRNLPPILQTCHLGELFLLKPGTDTKGIVTAYDPIDSTCPYFVAFPDGDTADFTSKEFAKGHQQLVTPHSAFLLAYSVMPNLTYLAGSNTTAISLAQKEWDLSDPVHVKELLSILIPHGKWSETHCTKLAGRLLTGNNFNPLYVPTEAVEIEALATMVDWSKLAGLLAIDLYAGSSEIPNILKKYIPIATNDFNNHFKPDFEYDALLPQNYKHFTKFQVAVTSVPFSLADLAIPLMFHNFRICFCHVPSWYVGDAHNIRHEWLAILARDGKAVVLNTNFARNKVLGRFCVWLVLSREPELLTSVIKASPFTMDLILAPPNHLTATVLATQHTETEQEINSTEEIFELAQL